MPFQFIALTTALKVLCCYNLLQNCLFEKLEVSVIGTINRVLKDLDMRYFKILDHFPPVALSLLLQKLPSR